MDQSTNLTSMKSTTRPRRQSTPMDRLESSMSLLNEPSGDDHPPNSPLCIRRIQQDSNRNSCIEGTTNVVKRHRGKGCDTIRGTIRKNATRPRRKRHPLKGETERIALIALLKWKLTTKRGQTLLLKQLVGAITHTTPQPSPQPSLF